MQLTRSVTKVARADVNPRTVGLLRIGIGLAGFLVWLEEAPVLARLADPSVLRVPYLAGLEIPAFFYLALAAVWLPAAALFALGFATRAAAVALVLTLVLALAADQQLYSNHLYLLLLATFLIAISLGAGRGSSRGPAGWPIALLRWQVSLVYGFAALAKLNPTYLSGSVVGSYLRDGGLLALPQDWRNFQLLFVLSIVGVLCEAFLAVALWLPRWRQTAFVVGLFLHTGIAIWLEPTSQLITFGALMLPLYLAFLDPLPRSMAVVWDDQCSFCRSWITWATRLDWLHALRLVPGSDAVARERLGISEAEALHALQVVTHQGRRSGYDGVVAIAYVLPVSFLWAALFRLPPIAAIGRRVYRKVADRRSCGLHAHGPHMHPEAGSADVPV